MSHKKVLIVAGEPSGDLHASDLVRNLKGLSPDIKFFGIGGKLSREAGVEIVYDISELAIVGLIEVIRHIKPIREAFRAVYSRIDSESPDLAILIDYPGFNLKLAKELKKRSIPVAYYISPQVWAWGGGRVNIIRDCVKKIVVFFKFEEEFYKGHGVNAEFVGHPLLDTVKPALSKAKILKRYSLDEKKCTIALLPGSRSREVKGLLGIMLASAKMIAGKLKDVQFVISKFEGLGRELYERAAAQAGLDVTIADGDTYNILFASDFAIVASGTATLETAIIGTPHIITYKINPLTYAIIRAISRLRFAGLANIIAGKEIVPELLQYKATPRDIAAKSIELLGDKDKFEAMKRDLAGIRNSLGSPGASLRAAQAILPLLNQ